MLMSRRKQPNPKPAKRETTDFDQVVPELRLPSSHLYLREFGGESLVLAKQRLTAGTVLGTYKGGLREPDAEGDKSFLKVNRSDGGSPVHVMLENEGHWLKLMRTAILPTDANICLRISGEEIVCTVTKDVNKEVELKVTCRIADEGNVKELDYSDLTHENFLLRPPEETFQSNSSSKGLNDSEASVEVSVTSEAMLDFASERLDSGSEDMTSKNSVQTDGDRMEVVKCRSNAFDSDSDMNEARDEVSSSSVHGSPSSDDKQNYGMPSPERIETQSSDRPGERKISKASEAEVIPRSLHHREEERIYKCHMCSYASADQYAVDKHLQFHRNQPGKRASSKLTNAKSFCEACKIQFMSVDTYHVHKQLYCKSRHEKDEAPLSPAMAEPTSGSAPIAFKPGPDTVIIRSGVNGGVTSSLIQPQAIYAAISTNPLILLPCSLVNGQGLVPQGGVVPTGAPGIVLQTGIACPTIVEKSPTKKLKEESQPSRKTSHPIMNFNAEAVDRGSESLSSLRKRKMSEGDVLNLKKTCTSVSVQPLDSDSDRNDSESTNMDQDGPLDLSLKAKSPNVLSRSPPKRKNSVASIGCPSPSYQNISDSGSPPRSSVLHSRATLSPSSSYSNDSVQCCSSQVPVVLTRLQQPVATAERLSPLPPVLQSDASSDKPVPPPGMPPPKLLKQGNNICEECHIVFYKYDNYLAHKKHYCAYRRQQLSAIAAAAAANQEQSSDDNNSNHSGHNEPNQTYHNDDVGKSGLRRVENTGDHFRSVITKPSHSVFCCDACGVKFSTSDNLNAHQTYYCIKKADSAMSKAAAMRADNSNSPKNIESPFSGPEEWKCNYCDATCSSYDTIRRHLLTHCELRGFRCIVCGYKGNTLRGMRSHACEHLTGSSTSIEEFVTTNVVAENGFIPIMPQMASHSDEDSDNSKDVKNAVGRERPCPERTRDVSPSLKKDMYSTDHSESNGLSNSPRMTENTSKDHVPKTSSPVKTESGASGSDAIGDSQQEGGVNPLSFCDVVIKTENDQSSSGDDSSREENSRSFIKFEPEPPEYDNEERPRDLSKSPTGRSTSVIRRAPDDKCEESFPSFQPSKRKSRSQTKNTPELKYCKSCDISFYHLSNFLAHKKFYCVSRVIQNCLQETATVQ